VFGTHRWMMDGNSGLCSSSQSDVNIIRLCLRHYCFDFLGGTLFICLWRSRCTGARRVVLGVMFLLVVSHPACVCRRWVCALPALTVVGYTSRFLAHTYTHTRAHSKVIHGKPSLATNVDRDSKTSSSSLRPYRCFHVPE